MKQYQELLNHVMKHGIPKDDRTGTGTLSVFGYMARFDLQEGLPIVTTKKLHLKSIIHELLWFLRGETNIKYLREHGVTIWDEWADEEGNLGRVYGAQWRSWRGADGQTVDQISQVVDQIKRNPDSRRHLVCSWNAAEVEDMALPPCHYAFQFNVTNGRLSCLFHMRSTDSFLGLPYNIASYALLTHMIAHQCGLEVGELVYAGGDVHIYLNHLEQVTRLLGREPYQLPRLVFTRKPDSLFDYQFDDFNVVGYEHHPAIKAPVAV